MKELTIFIIIILSFMVPLSANIRPPYQGGLLAIKAS